MRCRTSLVAWLLPLVPALASAAPCAVAWKALFDEAKSRGISFGNSSVDGSGTCFIHGRAFVASAADSADLTCQITLFVGARMKAGWNVRVIGDAMVPFAIKAAVPDLQNPRLEIKAERSTTVIFVPRQIEFNGPGDCRNWVDALTLGG